MGSIADLPKESTISPKLDATMNDKTTADTSINGSQTNIPPVTSILSDFISTASPSFLTPEIRTTLKSFLQDYISVTLSAADASDSTPSLLAAVKALGGETSTEDTKACTVLGVGKKYTPQYAGLLNAALGHSLDFDDTYAPGTLHPGVTAIPAALATIESLSSYASSAVPTTDDFLLAIALGYEVTCRLGRLLSNEAYARGFHNTSTAGIFGAVATIASLKRLTKEVIENAFGLAGSKASGSMQYLSNGSWNKRLHPGFAVHDAFQCVALAETGVLGASRIFEGEMGFFNAYSPRKQTMQDWNWLTGELGQRWHFLETGIKPFPACRMTHGFIEYAPSLGKDRGVARAKDVKKMTLSLSPGNVSVVGARTPNKLHPGNMVDAQFSAYFTTANSFLYGSDEGVRCYEKSRLDDREIYDLSDKITCVADDSIKEFGSKISVEYASGEAKEMDIPFPLGEVARPFTNEAAKRKFIGLVAPVDGEDRAQMIWEAVEGLDRNERGSAGEAVKELLKMLC